uniref:Uncharacterized protein n=1 Tax=Anguilla anguilla TaxID=7936 RepID=A0A0E9X0P9_ANGAN
MFSLFVKKHFPLILEHLFVFTVFLTIFASVVLFSSINVSEKIFHLVFLKKAYFLRSWSTNYDAAFVRPPKFIHFSDVYLQ